MLYYKMTNHVVKDCYHRCARCLHHIHDPNNCKYKGRDDDYYLEKDEKKAYYVDKDDKGGAVLACLFWRNI